MKHLKRWLALAVSAALALTLLAGCHTGGGISSRLLLDLLSGELENVQVETDSSFDRALRAAVQKGGADPSAVLDALIEELGISGGTVNFSISGIGNASAGRQSLNVVFQPGANPNTAANNAAAGWLGVLRGLAGSGEYSGLVSAVQVEGGYILAISVTVEQPGSVSSGGDGSSGSNQPTEDKTDGIKADGKYHVYTVDGLNTWANTVRGGNWDLDCVLEAPINLSDEWNPIGTSSSSAYTGTFDGQGNTISGLTISSGDYAGLFGYIKGGTVKDLELRDVSIVVSQNKYVGAVAGYSTGTIENCMVSGTVTGNGLSSGFSVGGVVGGNCGGKVIGCSSSAAVTGNGSAGRIGGIVGNNMTGSIIIACYHTDGVIGGNCTGSVNAGGVVGRNVASSITACYASCTVTILHAGGVGGVVGYNDRSSGIIEACYYLEGSNKNGVGNNSTHDGAIKIENDVTWYVATNGMNDKLVGKGWYYVINDNNTPYLAKGNLS